MHKILSHKSWFLLTGDESYLELEETEQFWDEDFKILSSVFFKKR